MPRDLLFIRADQDQIPDDHIRAFTLFCSANGVNVKCVDIKNIKDLEVALTGSFKYICFAGHGNEVGFGDQKNLTIKWDDIGELLCVSNCFTHNAKILLYCCKGGLHKVSCNLVESCDKLDFIMGVTNEQNSIDLLTVFSIFIYNMERNYYVGDEESAHRASHGTGHPIEHFHRRDFDDETGEFICRKCKDYWDEFGEESKKNNCS